MLLTTILNILGKNRIVVCKYAGIPTLMSTTPILHCGGAPLDTQFLVHLRLFFPILKASTPGRGISPLLAQPLACPANSVIYNDKHN